MDQSDTRRSLNTVYGEGYVYMGPLTPRQYQIPTEIPNNDNQYQFKVMLLGDSGVGKTCLLVRFNDETFPTAAFPSTVGIDYRSKTVTLGDKKINLQIFDTVSVVQHRCLMFLLFP